ncbi:multicopper oxidase family protein [Cohnella cellulosilytica]|uniref:Multicopper oxidase family protein n=1 Tax=Cohnella cellulosilytica TaxID=986710 RepID=A0ABW2FDQ9_9BACL
MFTILTGIAYASVFFLLILSWIAGSKASKLLYGGSTERLHRKTRKQIVWAAYLTVPALGIAAAALTMAATMNSVFWEDRVLLHLPLALIPLLSVWLLAVPRLTKLWRATRSVSAAPLPAEFRRMAAHPLAVLPYRISAIGAGTILYFMFVPPVPFRLGPILVPILLAAAAVAALGYAQERRYSAAGGRDAPASPLRRARWLRAAGISCVVIGAAALIFIVGSRGSRLPAEMSMADGPMDFGGGTELVHDPRTDMSLAMLTGPRDREPDRKFTLTAEKKTVELSPGKPFEAWTFNGQLPGPELRVKQGELVEVTLVNRDIEEGATVHWHGLDVPNAEDGVAGATQEAVMPGQKHVYRFVAEQTGTFWYHSHQHSQEAVKKGLFGSLVVEPENAEGSGAGEDDLIVMTHVWDGVGLAIGDRSGIQRKKVVPGTPVRLRLINTQDWLRQDYTLTGTPFRVAAIDGTELNEPRELEDVRIELTTGGRMDLTFLMPDAPVFLSVGRSGKLGVLLSRDGAGSVPDLPAKTTAFNPIDYGEPADTAITASSDFDREFEMVLDNKLAFYNGEFGSLYTINGEVFPNTPMFMVQEGDLVKTTIINRGAVDHPMHLHGHHMLVLSRNGEPSTGSPWYSDTLDVQPGEVYEVGFVADNPGLWMDHCHNLTHAAVGMSMHLMYEGITTPYKIGSETGNHPE